jgi:hypothetical protein
MHTVYLALCWHCIRLTCAAVLPDSVAQAAQRSVLFLLWLSGSVAQIMASVDDARVAAVMHGLPCCCCCCSGQVYQHILKCVLHLHGEAVHGAR